MPLELGIFLGAKRFGGKDQHSKECLIMDCEANRYQKFISDIAGQDIQIHNKKAENYILAIRDWLNNTTGSKPLPGGAHIFQRFLSFSQQLPEIAANLSLKESDLTFKDYAYCAKYWLSAVNS